MRRLKIKKTLLGLVASLIVFIVSAMILFGTFEIFKFEGIFRHTSSGLYFYSLPLSTPLFFTAAIVSLIASLHFFMELKEKIRKRNKYYGRF